MHWTCIPTFNFFHRPEYCYCMKNSKGMQVAYYHYPYYYYHYIFVLPFLYYHPYLFLQFQLFFILVLYWEVHTPVVWYVQSVWIVFNNAHDHACHDYYWLMHEHVSCASTAAAVLVESTLFPASQAGCVQYSIVDSQECTVIFSLDFYTKWQADHKSDITECEFHTRPLIHIALALFFFFFFFFTTL